MSSAVARTGEQAHSAIEFSTTSLGGNDWKYSYRVSGHAFDRFSGFEIYFDPAVYSNLDFAPLAPNRDWLVFTTQPDLDDLSADSIYTAQALTNGAWLADPFIVSFTFLGAGTPGSQPFDVFDTSFAVTETGKTAPARSAVAELQKPAKPELPRK